MANALSNLSLAQLKRAVEIKQQIESLENEINRLVGAPTTARAFAPRHAAGPRPKRRIWTAAARAKNAAYQRARRARLKGAKAAATPAFARR